MVFTDVLVVGAGVAGCAAAQLLARHHRVLVLDRFTTPRARIGESVPGASRRLLQRLGLLEEFEASGHRASLGQASLWGTSAVRYRDSLKDPLGCGWCIDRVVFDTMLRRAAQASGAQIVASTRLAELARSPGEKPLWLATFEMGELTVQVHANFLVLAHGRHQPFGELKMSMNVQYFDRLVCRFLTLPGDTECDALSGFSFVEAAPEGWWYRNTLPDGNWIVAYHTDSDLPSARQACRPEGFLELLRATQSMKATPVSCITSIQGTSARSQAANTMSGSDWCAIGDAVCAFDPLASQGIFNALYTGVRGAEAISARLRGDAQALTRYRQQMGQVVRAYRANLGRFYGLERRFSNNVFWQRRHRQTAPLLALQP
ncbi:NAD(P)/FAD-dependent oxidoreductase [Paraburkholderia hospita]|uniref:NAD(P)/FAD-dependent oxidoreductase n=1 Tax=Paraburkholderia hospita TaxID=169430 RepID=UPI000271B66C|nr:FAD-dependent monooxygenase [Paraburkholderia hospita]EUC12350.1 monooxygenase FAD-binding protein [Burkholderia sp. BT03]SKC51937.1 Dehydrogenase (flavoprotein) [Paraburkholderia hospita]